MPTKKMPSHEKKVTKKSPPTNATLQSLQARLEGLYVFHLVLLLVMSSLAGLLLVTIVQQKSQIESLKFRVQFLSGRYEWAKERASESSKIESGKATDEILLLPPETPAQ